MIENFETNVSLVCQDSRPEDCVRIRLRKARARLRHVIPGPWEQLAAVLGQLAQGYEAAGPLPLGVFALCKLCLSNISAEQFVFVSISIDDGLRMFA